MKRTQLTTDGRGQTTPDYAIGFTIFIVFVITTFFIGSSPVVDGDNNDVYLQSETEQALVEIQTNALQNNAGEYTTEAINDFTTTSNPRTATTLSDEYNTSVTLTPTTPEEKPLVFHGNGDDIHIGDTPPDAATYTANTTINVDDRPVHVSVTVWRVTSE